jgi:cell division protein FtsB
MNVNTKIRIPRIAELSDAEFGSYSMHDVRSMAQQILRQQAEIADLRQSGDESDAESARLLAHARKVKGDRDVHSVYEVLDLIPRLRAEIAELRRDKERLERALAGVRNFAHNYTSYHSAIRQIIDAAMKEEADASE